MKKLIVVTLVPAVLAVAILAASCNEKPSTASLKSHPQVASAAPVLSNDLANDQAILQELKRATQSLIDEYSMVAQPAPDDCYAVLNSIEDAQRSLSELEEERQAILLGVNEYCRATAQPIPDDLAATLRRIDGDRTAILKRLGLVD